MRYNPQDKIKIIREVSEDSNSVFSTCRKYKISKASLYKWLKIYRAAKKNRALALGSKVLRLSKHPRALTWVQRQAVLGLVHKHPQYSCRKVAQALGLGYHGVQNILYQNELNRYFARFKFSQKPFWKRDSSERRSAMMLMHQAGWKVSDICRHFNISKTTFCKWRKRWESADPANRAEALSDKYISGANH